MGRPLEVFPHSSSFMIFSFSKDWDQNYRFIYQGALKGIETESVDMTKRIPVRQTCNKSVQLSAN